MNSKNLRLNLRFAALVAAVALTAGCATAKKGEMAEPAAPADPTTKMVRTEKVPGATELFEFPASGMSTLNGLLSNAGQATGTFPVTGHTDRLGPEDYNMGLSQTRAQSVSTIWSARVCPQDRSPLPARANPNLWFNVPIRTGRRWSSAWRPTAA